MNVRGDALSGGPDSVRTQTCHHKDPPMGAKQSSRKGTSPASKAAPAPSSDVSLSEALKDAATSPVSSSVATHDVVHTVIVSLVQVQALLRAYLQIRLYGLFSSLVVRRTWRVLPASHACCFPRLSPKSILRNGMHSILSPSRACQGIHA